MPDKLADCRTTARRRAVDRRGRLGRGPGEGRTQLRVHGGAAAARQGRQRRQVQPEAGHRERRGAGAVHGHRCRVGPRLQPRRRPLRAHHHPVRRRRRRQPHPLPAAHADLPLHAAPARGRPRVRGAAAAVHHEGRRPEVHAFSDEDKARLTEELCQGQPQGARTSSGSGSRASARWTSRSWPSHLPRPRAPASCGASPWTTPSPRLDAASCSRPSWATDVARRRQFLLGQLDLVDRDALDV
jgi:hypothetical protein